MLGCIIGAVITLIIIIFVLAWRLLWYEHTTRSGGFITADKYQKRVKDEYRHLRPPKKRIPYSEFCYNRQGYKIQPQQILVSDYLRPRRDVVDSFLVIHKIGAGKTCLAIQIGLKWIGKSGGSGENTYDANSIDNMNSVCKDTDDNNSVCEDTYDNTVTGDTDIMNSVCRDTDDNNNVVGGAGSLRPLFVMPASLIPGFYNELRSQCAGNRYITEEERLVGDTEVIERSNARINRDFNIMSYNKFATAMDNGSGGTHSVNAPILVIDEMQNINNPGGKYFAAVRKWTERYSGPIVLMSATPLFDSVAEIEGIAMLMRLKFTSPIKPGDIGALFAGRVSYYAGADPITFPDVTVAVKKCVMSKHQAKWYRAQVEAEMKKSGEVKLRNIAESFYIKSRQKSNIVYPKGVSGANGLQLLTRRNIISSLGTYSAKFATLMKKLLRARGAESLSFVYSGFTGAGGIAAITACLRAVGYKDYFAEGPGRRRYVVWSGEQTSKEKNSIREVFNSAANDDASQIQVVIGSPAMKEGVSLMRVRTVHIMESYWNFSLLDQIMGRAIRYCSHRTLPSQDRNVTVYIYAAVVSTSSANSTLPENSIDLYMLDIAEKKRNEIEPYMNAMMDIAVDKLVYGM